MKILHVTHHYIDGWGYQDNLLPLYQCRSGNNVVVVADNNHLSEAGSEIKNKILSKGHEYWLEGVKIIRINCYLNTKDTSFICSGLLRILRKEKPDLIFHHGVNSSTLLISYLYKLRNSNVVLFVDNHADTINQSKNKVWVYLYYKIFLRVICSMITPKIDRYFGVSFARCKYLHKMFGIPKEKISFLPLGGDTDLVESLPNDREVFKKQYNIPESAFIIISGGKMDSSKGTIGLIDAFLNFNKIHPDSYLILFGRMSNEIKSLVQHCNIVSIGWCDREQTLSLLKMANVAVWPLLHTTLIEDAIACGTPLIVKISGNTQHLIEEGNGIYMSYGDKVELIKSLNDIFEKYSIYNLNAISLKYKYSYYNIVKMIKDQYELFN